MLNIKNKSHTVTSEIVAPESGAAGVIVAQEGAEETDHLVSPEEAIRIAMARQ